MVELENLERMKAKKKAELEGLINELQSQFRFSGPLEPSGKIADEYHIILKTFNELQEKMKHRRTQIETIHQEIQEGNDLIKELWNSIWDSESVKREELVSNFKHVHEKMVERKQELGASIQEVELLKMNYLKPVKGNSP